VAIDFRIRDYEDLLREIGQSGRPVFPVGDYFGQRETPPAFFVLRHDVDRRPNRALRMAEVEIGRGIRSTYYFRVTPGVFNTDVVMEIAAMGHEIGYHYEVLDKARGRLDLAEKIFRRELDRLRSIADVKTASMHGSPLSRWDNRDFWKDHRPQEFGLLGEAYISVAKRDLVYLTDTGRGWNRTLFNLRDRFAPDSIAPLPSFRHTRELAEAIRQGRFKRIYLQVHPNRWTSGGLEGYGQWVEDWVLNAAKWLLARCYHRRLQHEDPARQPSL
jgi:hypothetical protein